jgi:hypothetical protein
MQMTREQFEDWIRNGDGPPVLVRAPFDIEPCDCRDPNCRGWRLVERVVEQRARLPRYDEVLG